MQTTVVALAIFILLIGSQSLAATPQLLKVGSFHQDKDFIAELEFDKPLQNDNINVDFVNETVQVNIPGVRFPASKVNNRINENNIRNIYTYAAGKNKVRCRIIYKKGWQTNRLSESVSLYAEGNFLRIHIAEPPPTAKARANEVSKIVPVEDDNLPDPIKLPREFSGDFIRKAALVAKSSKVEKGPDKTHQETNSNEETAVDRAAEIISRPQTEKTDGKSKTRELSEAEIPVLTEATKGEGSKANPYMRMIISMIVIFGLFGGLTFFLQRWNKNRKFAGPKGDIKVLTQHHIGPKKSLAIIRVAGESMLVGITDHSISMIKSLSLLDEDIPGQIPQDFINTLKSTETNVEKPKARAENKKTEDNEAFAMHGLNEIRDMVSKRLKEMRPIE